MSDAPLHARNALSGGVLAGYVLFRGAPALIGRAPWDGGFVYLALLVAAGALLALLDRHHVWPAPAGIYAGQALAIAVDWFRGALTAGGPPVLLQVAFLAAPTLCALCGAAAMTVLAGTEIPDTPASRESHLKEET